MKNRSDEELMRLYQSGTEEAFRILYDRHSSKIYGFIKGRISSPERAADVFQEVFFRLHRSKNLYLKDHPVLPWLFTITRNTIVDELRKTKHQSQQVDIHEMDLPAPEVAMTKTLLPDQMAALPANQKAAMEMRYVEEKTFEEIAQILQTSEANTRQLISRGVKRLKELLGSEGDKP